MDIECFISGVFFYKGDDAWDFYSGMWALNILDLSWTLKNVFLPFDFNRVLDLRKDLIYLFFNFFQQHLFYSAIIQALNCWFELQKLHKRRESNVTSGLGYDECLDCSTLTQDIGRRNSHVHRNNASLCGVLNWSTGMHLELFLKLLLYVHITLKKKNKLESTLWSQLAQQYCGV